MKRGVYMANDTKPSLYEYYLKLVPDTVIFDEIERIAWQKNVICGSFNGKGDINENGDLFFYSDGADTSITKISTHAYRIFLKVYDMTLADVDTYKEYLNSIKNINYVFMQDNIAELSNDSTIKYIVLDSSNIIDLPLKYKKDDNSDYIDIFNGKCIIGVVF